MQDKTHRHKAPWANFNGTAGGHVYKDSVSEPVTEREALRLKAAMGGTYHAIPTIEEPDEQVAADRADAGMKPEATGKATTKASKASGTRRPGGNTTSKAKAPSRAAGTRSRKGG